MKQNIHRDGNVKREGIALVAVLGFLSILILMAVAFLMNMRTERLVAESAKDDVRTRQLTRGALASAMDSVDGFLDSPAQLRVRMPVNYVVFESTNGTAPLKNVHLIDGQVTNWLPRQFLPGGMFNARSIEENSAKWVLVKDPATNRILGRYAFLIMDCTGMMDANLTDYPVQRGGGTSITEVSSAFLPEAVDATLVDKDLHNNRVNYSMFGTFPEILFLNDGITNASGYPEKHALEATRINNLMPYSLCYDNGWWDGTQWHTADIDGLPIDVRSWLGTDVLDIQKAFTDVGYTAPQAANMSWCVKDYLDDNDDPDNPSGANSVCGEAIPMINEIIVTNEIMLVDTTNIRHRVWFDVELWYPFLGYTNQHDYSLNIVSAKFRWPNARLQPKDPNNFAPDPAVYYNAKTDPALKVIRCGPFEIITNDLSVLSSDVLFGVRDISIQLLRGIVVVDSVQPGATLKFEISANPVLPWRGQKDISVTDPRLNHLASFADGTKNWDTPPSATYKMINYGMPYLGTNINNQPEGLAMYVRNSTNLGSVAELGFIPTGDRWTTIDLFSTEGRDLLAKFRTRTLTTKSYTNGLINPNSLYTNVLIAAFREAPVNEYPGGPVLFNVNDQMAVDIVESIYANGTSSYDSAAGWVTTEAFATRGTLMDLYENNPSYNMNNTKKESIIRNSYQLFNPNQQLFTIVVIAQVINDQGTVGTFDEEDDAINGEKRAVALVWRDPFPNPSGRHEMFVKLFKYLDE